MAAKTVTQTSPAFKWGVPAHSTAQAEPEDSNVTTTTTTMTFEEIQRQQARESAEQEAEAQFERELAEAMRLSALEEAAAEAEEALTQPDASTTVEKPKEEEDATVDDAKITDAPVILSDEDLARALQSQFEAEEELARFERNAHARKKFVPFEKVSSAPEESLNLKNLENVLTFQTASQSGRNRRARPDEDVQNDEDSAFYYSGGNFDGGDGSDSDSFDEDDFYDPAVWFEDGGNSHDVAGPALVGASQVQAQKPHHSAAKPNGRVPAREYGNVRSTEPVLMTKHDAALHQVRNARALETVLAAGGAGDLRGIGISDRVFHGVTQRHFRQQGHRNRARGNRLDATTKEQVLDARTRGVLLKLLNSDVLDEFHGVVSTGKEANVYHALAGRSATEAVSSLTTGLAPAFAPSEGSDDGIAALGASFAVKVYKTTMNEFKNRIDYIEGERRFQNATSSLRGNPRKLIKLWAEKEARNLKRMCMADLPVPVPLVLKGNVLVMQFLGRKRTPFPRLTDVDWQELPQDVLRGTYVQLAKLMRRMYHGAKLVHGDLSEFNVLVDPRSLKRVAHGKKKRRGGKKSRRGNKAEVTAAAAAADVSDVGSPATEGAMASDDAAAAAPSPDEAAVATTKAVSFAPEAGAQPTPQLFVIDVSQSVEHDHPRALEFLRQDCNAVTQFFAKAGLAEEILTVRQLFDFTVDARLDTRDVDRYLAAMQRENCQRQADGADGATDEQRAAAAEADVLDAVFMNKQTHIPRTLQEIPSEDAVEELFQQRDSLNRSRSGSNTSRSSASSLGDQLEDDGEGGADDDGNDGNGGLSLRSSTSLKPFHTASTLGHDLEL